MFDEELYNRQGALPLAQIDEAVVVGLGGTGSWVALFLVMSGCPKLHLMDMDILEPSNFNRIPLPYNENLGRKKTEAMSWFLNSLRPDCLITTHTKANPFSLAMTDGSHLFDCTDDQDTQIMLSKWAGENDKRYIRVGYNGGSHITVTDRVPEWNVGKKQGTYEIVPSWVIPAALSACFGVAKAMLDDSINVADNIVNIGNGGN